MFFNAEIAETTEVTEITEEVLGSVAQKREEARHAGRRDRAMAPGELVRPEPWLDRAPGVKDARPRASFTSRPVLDTRECQGPRPMPHDRSNLNSAMARLRALRGASESRRSSVSSVFSVVENSALRSLTFAPLRVLCVLRVSVAAVLR